ncbi:MAG: 4Fe-4S dicluster domain-containing protein [Candidatus Latescibacterota bacterium]
MTRMVHLCDEDRCIACASCIVACKVGHDISVGVSRRKVYTLAEGTADEKSISVACRHCAEPACMAVCPQAAITKRADGVVQTNKAMCISCKSCLDACPFGIPAFLEDAAGNIGPQEKCTFCAGGPNTEPFSEAEMKLYGQNRLAEGKPPLCAAFCSTKALLSGEEAVVRDILDQRQARRYRMTS